MSAREPEYGWKTANIGMVMLWIVAGATLVLILTGCSPEDQAEFERSFNESVNKPDPDEVTPAIIEAWPNNKTYGNGFYTVVLHIEEGRELLCVARDQAYGDPMSCDWVGYHAGSRRE